MIKKATIILIFLAFTPMMVGGVGHYPESDSDYKIRFGWMKKKADGSYYVYKETKMIPLRLKETGFRWGYTTRRQPPEMLPIEPVGAGAWASATVVLRERYPSWNYLPGQ